MSKKQRTSNKSNRQRTSNKKRKLRGGSRKISIKSNKSKKSTKKSKKSKSKKIKMRVSHRGGGASQCGNEYLFVKGIDLPSSEYTSDLKINDQFAKLGDGGSSCASDNVDHPHLSNKFSS